MRTFFLVFIILFAGGFVGNLLSGVLGMYVLGYPLELLPDFLIRITISPHAFITCFTETIAIMLMLRVLVRTLARRQIQAVFD